MVKDVTTIIIYQIIIVVDLTIKTNEIEIECLETL